MQDSSAQKCLPNLKKRTNGPIYNIENNIKKDKKTGKIRFICKLVMSGSHSIHHDIIFTTCREIRLGQFTIMMPRRSKCHTKYV